MCVLICVLLVDIAKMSWSIVFEYKKFFCNDTLAPVTAAAAAESAWVAPPVATLPAAVSPSTVQSESVAVPRIRRPCVPREVLEDDIIGQHPICDYFVAEASFF